jgi:hypothetical protein
MIQELDAAHKNWMAQRGVLSTKNQQDKFHTVGLLNVQ